MCMAESKTAYNLVIFTNAQPNDSEVPQQLIQQPICSWICIAVIAPPIHQVESKHSASFYLSPEVIRLKFYIMGNQLKVSSFPIMVVVEMVLSTLIPNLLVTGVSLPISQYNNFVVSHKFYSVLLLNYIQLP